MSNASAATTRYQFDPALGRFAVHAYSTGLLSFVGHDPVFTVREFNGWVTFEDDMIARMQMELHISAASLEVTGSLNDSERQEIERRMRTDILDTREFPEIIFQASVASADRIGSGKYRMGLAGTLQLRGYTRPHHSEAELSICADGLRLKGETQLRISEFRIPPVTALGGMIRLKDELTLRFDLGARPEPA